MKNFKNLLLYFPAINVTADFLFVFEPLKTFITYLRGSILILVVFFFIFRYGNHIWRINKAIILMFIYFSILLSQSSNLNVSFPFFLKFFSGIIMFPVFYMLVIHVRDLRIVKRSFFITLFVFVLNFILADLFNLGTEIYSDGQGDFQTGNITASGLYTGSLLLIAAPLIYSLLKSNSSRIYFIILNFSTVLMLILAMRRTALLIVVIGYATIGFFYRQKSSLYRYGIMVFAFTAIIVSINFDKIQNRIEVRSNRFEDGSLEKEGRYIETALIYTNIFNFDDLSYTILGREIFNSPGSYGYPDPERVIHVDFNIILSGSGLIGLFLYLIFNYKILVLFLKLKTNGRKSDLYYLFWVTGFAIFTISILTSFSSGLFAITYRTSTYALLGVVLAILNREIIPVGNFTKLKQAY